MALKCGEIEGNGRAVLLVLSKKVVPPEVLAGEIDKVGWGRLRERGEELVVNMAADMLDSQLVEAGGGGNCEVNVSSCLVGVEKSPCFGVPERSSSL